MVDFFPIMCFLTDNIKYLMLYPDLCNYLMGPVLRGEPIGARVSSTGK